MDVHITKQVTVIYILHFHMYIALYDKDFQFD